MAASCKTLLAAAAMALAVVTAALLPATAVNTFTVGDDSGWDVGVDYVAWASGKTFNVGDILVFRPKSTEQDVVQVDEQDFSDCTVGDNALVKSSGGNAVALSLDASATYFFISDAEGECASGMKLAVNVQ